MHNFIYGTAKSIAADTSTHRVPIFIFNIQVKAGVKTLIFFSFIC